MDLNIRSSKLQKGRDGWEAKTEYSMGAAKERHGDKFGERVLLIYTKKSQGGMQSRATVSLNLGGWNQHVVGYGTPSGDYSKKVLTSGKRATEKGVRELHVEALTHAGAILAEAAAHYALQDAERAKAAAAKAGA